MSDDTLTQINHYQKKLEKYAATGESDKILCCIHKLKYLPVTVNHLEVTGVGKSINGLRHNNGVVGEKARALVHKWKLMVAEEEEEQQQLADEYLSEPEESLQRNKNHSRSNTPREEHEEGYLSEEGDRLQIREEPVEDVDDNITYNPVGHNVEDEEENFNGCYNPKTSREDYLSIGSKEVYEYKPTTTKEPEESYVYKPTSKHESKRSYEYLPTTKCETDESYEYKPTIKEPVEEHPSHSSSEKSSLPNGDAVHSDKIRKDKSSHHRSREESKHKKKKHKSKHDHEDKYKSSEHDSSFDHKKEKHKSSKNKDKRRDKDKEKESSKETSHSSSNKQSSSSSSSHKNKNIETSSPLISSNHGNSYNNNSSSSSGSSNNPLSSSSDLKRHKEREDDYESQSSRKSKSGEKQKEKKLHKSSKSSKDDHKSSKRKREDTVEAPSEFEAALMGMESTSSKKKKKKRSKEKEKKEKEVPGLDTPPRTPSDGSPKLRELNLDYREQLPQLPSNFDTDTSASQLSVNYKPLPHVPQRIVTKDSYSSSMTNEEALNYMFTSKNSSKQRRIYTGKMAGSSSVPSLFNICIKFLQDNIDLLETTGNITYDILKPVLEKASPQQLITLEDFNPYLLEDTDALWSNHCRKHFKNKQREEMETWRDMYLRCTDDHQERMRIITENLQKKYVTKAPPKRTTQLAYINTAAKPPKSVARAQARYGTASTSAAPARTSSSKTVELQNAASGSSSNGGNSNNAVSRPDKPFPNKPPALKKPKVAPLMGKARQLMKKVCRR